MVHGGDIVSLRLQTALSMALHRDDLVLPFQVDPYGLRGRLVRLGAAADTIASQHGYPDPVSKLIVETLALACCLAAALKYDGIFTLQVKGDGPVRTLVTDVTSDGGVRAYCSFDAARVAALGEQADGSVHRMLGGGYIAFTVDQGPHTERYQGIVELQGPSLAECAHTYFRQSEQLQTGIKLAAGRGADGKWRAAAIMVQRMPYTEAEELPKGVTEDDYDDSWLTAVTLMSSVTDAELLDPGLSPDRLLYRLFQEPGVRAYPPQEIAPVCRCSRERVESVLRSLGDAEIEEMKTDEGSVLVNCEFCGTKWRFDDDDLARLRAPSAAPTF